MGWRRSGMNGGRAKTSQRKARAASRPGSRDVVTLTGRRRACAPLASDTITPLYARSHTCTTALTIVTCGGGTNTQRQGSSVLCSGLNAPNTHEAFTLDTLVSLLLCFHPLLLQKPRAAASLSHRCPLMSQKTEF